LEPKKKFKLDINVRFRDLDALGHVNNSVYFTYFEEGRTTLFRTVFGDDSLRFILAHACCDYVRPATLNDRLTLNMSVGKIGTKSFELQYELTDRKDTGTVFAKGESIQVCFDYEQNRSVPVSEALKDQLLDYQWNFV
jgi:acyl-CoA thioester hydrolase